MRVDAKRDKEQEGDKRHKVGGESDEGLMDSSQRVQPLRAVEYGVSA